MPCLVLDGGSVLKSSFPKHNSGSLCWEVLEARSRQQACLRFCGLITCAGGYMSETDHEIRPARVNGLAERLSGERRCCLYSINYFPGASRCPSLASSQKTHTTTVCMCVGVLICGYICMCDFCMNAYMCVDTQGGSSLCVCAYVYVLR